MRRGTFGERRSSASRASITSLTSTRNSMSTGQRRSSSTTVKLANPRNKDYQQRCIKRLMEFCIENSYPHQISTKTLMNPSCNDFIRIFEFLYRYLLPNYVVKGRYEEEIPQIFKLLNYPVSISKSYMFSVGTPHSKPVLLQALTWLMELVQLAFSCDIDEVMLQDADPTSSLNDDVISSDRALQYEYMTNTYTEFLSGKDEYPELQSQLEQAIDEKQKSVRKNIERLELEVEKQLVEIEALENDPLSVDNLIKKQETLAEDRKMYTNYLQQMELRKTARERTNQTQLEEIASLESSIENDKRATEEIMLRIGEQKLSVSEAEKMKEAIAEKNTIYATLRDERDKICKEVWNAEIQMSKDHDEYEENYQTYVTYAKKLSILPLDAENACGIDFELHINQDCVDRVRKVIKPKLLEIKRDNSAKTRRYDSMIVTEENNNEELSQSISKLQNSYKGLKTEIASIEKNITGEKDKFAIELEKVEGEMAMVESELRDYLASGSRPDQYRHQLEKLKNEKEKFLEEIDILTDDKNKDISKIKDIVMKHKKFMKTLAEDCSIEATKVMNKTKHAITNCKERTAQLCQP